MVFGSGVLIALVDSQFKGGGGYYSEEFVKKSIRSQSYRVFHMIWLSLLGNS